MNWEEAVVEMKNGNIITVDGAPSNGATKKCYILIDKNDKFIALIRRSKDFVAQFHAGSSYTSRTDYIVDNSEKELFYKLLG